MEGVLRPFPRRGASLIEALLVLAIASILFLAGAASVSRSAGRYDLERGVWEVRSLLSQTRVRAIWEGVPARLTIGVRGYSMDLYDEGAKSWRVAAAGDWQGVAVEANNTPVYQPTGSVTGMATIIVSNPRGAYRLTLAITGRIRATKL